jgi:integrase
MNGSLFKRCGCRHDQATPDGGTTSVRIGQSCPKLKTASGAWNSKHGTWAFQLAIPVPTGAERVHLRRSGYRTLTAAQSALNRVVELLALADDADEPDLCRVQIAELIRPTLKNGRALPDPEEIRTKVKLGQAIDSHLTVAAFLREWIGGKKDIKTTTRREYRRQIEQYLIPLLGGHRLDRLRPAHVQAAFDEIARRSALAAEQNAQRKAVLAETKAAWREHRSKDARAARALLATLPGLQSTPSPAALQRIRACLRSALTDAQKQMLVTLNVAKLVNLDPARRPKARVWTDARVKLWRETGQQPSPVMVWSTEQTKAFLTHARPHPLYPLYLLVFHCGLRRGEAVALRWADIDFTTGRIEIQQQIIQDGWDVITEPTTKSDAGDRAVIATKPLLRALAKLKLRQDAHAETRKAAGEPWANCGLVFVGDDGAPLHPQTATDEFRRLIISADLPPIRLHDGRHGAATQALAAGVEMKVVSELLGHSSTAITADTYSSVLDELKRDAADKIAHRLALEDDDEDDTPITLARAA